MKMAPAISWSTKIMSRVQASKEAAMTQSMISFVVGIVMLLCVAMLAAARHRREHIDKPITQETCIQ